MDDLRGAQAFVAVAEQRSFSGAARAAGVTPSALSQAVRSLEDRLGVPLLVRTTRSVGLTEAGRRLLERLTPALRETGAALAEARGAAEMVQGTLRITAGRLTVPLVVEPILRPMLQRHPALSIEVSVDDRFVDIVTEGFDAGIRLSESIQSDFTAVRLTPPFRLLVAGAPSYFARHRRPREPGDLLEHDCINYRSASSGSFYAWEFARRGRELQVAVKGRVACNDGAMMLRAALDGLGLVYLHEQALAPHVARGELELALVDHAVTVPGVFLYFARKSGLQPKLRAFIDLARRSFGAPFNPRAPADPGAGGPKRPRPARRATRR